MPRGISDGAISASFFERATCSASEGAHIVITTEIKARKEAIYFGFKILRSVSDARRSKDRWFDVRHLDGEKIKMSYRYARDYLRERLCRLPHFSSEVFYWERHYYEARLDRPRSQSLFPPAACCRELIQRIITQLKTEFHEPLQCVDVGCGPQSQLFAKNILDDPKIEVVGVDPLAATYNELHKKYPTGYRFACIPGYGETLVDLFHPETFHLVCSQNAIDHSQSPDRFVHNLFMILKPGGYLILRGFTKTGTYEGWRGLHQWDIELANGELLMTNRTRSIQEKNLTAPYNKEIYYVDASPRDLSHEGYEVVYKKKRAHRVQPVD